jgi:hypothetical protein
MIFWNMLLKSGVFGFIFFSLISLYIKPILPGNHISEPNSEYRCKNGKSQTARLLPGEAWTGIPCLSRPVGVMI